MTFKDFFSLRANKFFWLNILAMIIVAILLFLSVFKGLDIYTHHGEEVTVPNVIGMMPNQADKLFRDQGLIAKVVNTSYQRNMPSGCILELTPACGEKVKKGRIIFLTINSINAPLREVPDVTENSSAREAEAQLLAAGFHLTQNNLVDGELDWVYGVTYNGRRIMTGEKIPSGSTLTLQIGNGNVPATPEENDSVSLNEDEKGSEDKEGDPVNNTQTVPVVQTEKVKSKTTKQQPAHKNDHKKISKKDHKNENSNDSWF